MSEDREVNALLIKQINEAPEPLRSHIHDITTRCDPSGDMQRIRFLEETVEAQERRIAELRAPISMKKVYLLTSGTGYDGDEWAVHSIHSTRESAEEAKVAYEAPRSRNDGTFYSFDAQVEEWDLLGPSPKSPAERVRDLLLEMKSYFDDRYDGAPDAGLEWMVEPMQKVDEALSLIHPKGTP